jgi:hypothetical protein
MVAHEPFRREESGSPDIALIHGQKSFSWASDGSREWSSPRLTEPSEYKASPLTPFSDSWSRSTTPSPLPWTADDLYRQSAIPRLPALDFEASVPYNIRRVESETATKVYHRDLQ